MALLVGDQALLFTLPNQNGELVSLESFRGKIVLVYFYPKALTPGCTVQACALSTHKSKFTKKEIVVLGISLDQVKKLKNFEEKKELNFDLLSDENHGVSDLYGVYGEKSFMGRKFMGLHRKSFIIDRQGKIAAILEKVNTKTHHDDVLQIVSESKL